MTTARNIIKNRIRAGNTLLGVGCYSAAILPKKKNANKVIKVGNTVDDPWLDFYERSVLRYPDNPYFPKVYDFHIDYDNDYYVAVVEKLNSVHDCPARNESLEELISQWCKHGIELHSLQSLSADHDVNTTRLHEAVNSIHEIFVHDSEPAYECNGECQPSIDSYDEEEGYNEDYDCECVDNNFNIDLHSGNFMYRKDGTIVINDPLCHSEMDDIDDISNWADEYKIKVRCKDQYMSEIIGG